MAEEQPSLHIDTDWKKQAQQEKKRLAEEAAARAAAAPPPIAALSGGIVAPTSAGGAAAGGASAPTAATPRRGAPGQRQLPPPSFAAIVQSAMTQVLFYLGELASAGGQGGIDLDMAKHQLDTLAVLEEKTKNNLTEQEQSLLDAALYETRSRFISVASQFLGP
jgi:hypothetical protein